MNITEQEENVNVDGVNYYSERLSQFARDQISNIQFSDVRILQLKNELNISNTARTGYLRALKNELAANEEDVR
jgi:hypothetical protein